MKTTPLFFIITILMIQSTINPAVAEQSEPAKTFDSFTIYIENDYFAGTDYGYTGGFQLTWSTPFQLKRKGISNSLILIFTGQNSLKHRTMIPFSGH